MRHVHIPDEILRIILSRFPGKALLRLRCLSKQWNGVISDPYFMNSRSRPMIFLPNQYPLAVLDDKEEDNNPYSILKIKPPQELETHLHAYTGTKVSIIGTFNGLVILSLTSDSYLRTHMYLYNPLTSTSKKLLVMNKNFLGYSNSYVFGFSYDDFKIVRFAICNGSYQITYDVFDLKTSLWSKPQLYPRRDFWFWNDTGMFVNGFLYWLIVVNSIDFEILALNVKEMMFSRIYLPNGCNYNHACRYKGTIMGSQNGRLCMINKNNKTSFDMWVMKEQAWLKATSFTFGLELEGNFINEFYPMCILSNGKILLTNGSHQLVIFNTITGSHKMVDDLFVHFLEAFVWLSTICVFQQEALLD
ncbi:F-box/kelch-repeat protein At3g06240-like [Rutidosis leptorrhynchoides]|uniref:F-box/kelch-repeat protein At3g06240-like n=1 Tax=Rutidosis leptorrhynchoides TaxID=125765 RepID=UPI003A99528A